MIEKKLRKQLAQFLVHKNIQEIHEFIKEHYVEKKVRPAPPINDASEDTQYEAQEDRVSDSIEESEFLNTIQKTIQQNKELIERLPEDSDFDTGFRTYSISEFDKMEEKYPIDASGLDDPNHIGPYPKKNILGAGGMGSVWQVTDPSLYRSVALKVIHSQPAQDVSERNNFVDEAQITAQLQHPGIVPVYELGSLPSGHLYFTMKEIKGRTLKEVMHDVHTASAQGTWTTSESGWTFRKLIATFYQVCQTIEYAHSRGVVHCDIKPSNIMVGDYGEVLVVDWGIAKIIRDSNNPNHIVTKRMQDGHDDPEMLVSGTPAYMSPEQAAGMNHLVNERSDVYCLGSTLYHILRGVPPFQGSQWSIISQKCSKSPVSVRKPIQNGTALFIPDELVHTCEKAMQRLPKNRFASVSEMSDAILQWLDGVQRKEKAMQILEKSTQLEEHVRQLRAKQKDLYIQAQYELEASVQSEMGWSLWRASQKCAEEASQSKLEIEQLLQGALIYDSQLSIIHEKLAEIEYGYYLEAYKRQNHRAKNRYWRRFQTYLDVLSSEQQQYWNKRQKSDVSAFSFVQRERGVFVGREDAVQDCVSILTNQKRLCILGAAGVGKTHLSLEVGSKWRDKNQHAIYFCDLANVHEQQGLFQVISRALHMTFMGKNPIKEIQQVLCAKPCLLIFDNVEHMVPVLISFLSETDAPDLSILITSRIRIKRIQLSTYKIMPMRLLEGMELFATRAQKQKPDFSITDQNRFEIGALVRKLDCLPLAIELAAARVSTFGVEEIAKRMSNRFELLKGRVRETKKKALAAALDWSWELLSDFGKATLLQCSTFRGGCALVAVEQIVKLSHLNNAPLVVDVVEALCDDSLLFTQRQNDGTKRYGILASVQEYASQKLRTSMEIHEKEVLIRHARYYAQWASPFLEEHTEKNMTELHVEIDNIITGVFSGAMEDSYVCCLAVMKYFRVVGPITRGIHLSDTFLQRSDVVGERRHRIELLRISLLRGCGSVKQAKREIYKLYEKVRNNVNASVIHFSLDTEFQIEMGCIEMDLANYEGSERYFRNAIRLSQRYEFEHWELKAQTRLGMMHRVQGKYQDSLHRLEAALRLAQTQKSTEQEMIALGEVGTTCIFMMDYNQAEQYLLEALKIAKHLGNKRWTGRLYGSLGLAYHHCEKHEQSIALTKKSIQIAKSIGDRVNECTFTGNIGYFLMMKRLYKRAKPYLRKSQQIAYEIGERSLEVKFSSHLGFVYMQLEQYEKSALIYEKSAQIAKEIGDKRMEGINFGNCGDAHFGLGDYEKSTDALQKAIQLCDVHIPPAGGAFRGTLALIHAKEGRLEDSLALMDVAEKQLLALEEDIYSSENKDEFLKLFIKKGTIQCLSGQLEKAKKTIDDIQKQIQENDEPKSFTRRELSRLIDLWKSLS